MEQLSEKPSFEERLTHLWQQGSREVTIAFLRRAVRPDMTLEELLATLRFRDVQRYLQEIRLEDIMPNSAYLSAGRAVQVYPKRKRRNAEQMQELKNRLKSILIEEEGESLNTLEICERLQADGHRIDTIRVGSLMKTLQQEEEGTVMDLGGKPKVWRVNGRKRAGDPIMMSKKHMS